jgi:hypothetical protein
MTKAEMQLLLAEHLAKFRAWTYEQLAERVEQDRRNHECLEYLERVAADGTQYQVEFNALWDDQPRDNIRVIGHLSAEPQKRLFGLLPVYLPDASDSFIMTPAGGFIGE